jgi:Protein of unknown function (DUF3176)
MVILLGLFDNKAYSDWQSSITLNAMISVLVSLLYIVIMLHISSCIAQLKWNHFATPHRLHDVEVFDSAARSVPGSFKLLLAHPKRLVCTHPTSNAVKIDSFV